VIIGENNLPAEEGYVYEFDLPENEIIKGTEKEDQGIYAYQKPLRAKNPKTIKRQEIEKYIIYVKDMKELIQVIYNY